jgi:peptide/nickel transport system permease protein
MVLLQSADASTTEAPAPSARRMRRWTRSGKVMAGAIIVGFFILVAIFGPMLAPHSADFQVNHTSGVPLPPSGKYLLGTDQRQHDMLSLLLRGGRSTLLIAFIAGALATVLSIAVGVTAGFVGGLLDAVLSMLANIFLALPGLVILMVVMKPLPPDDTDNPILIGSVIALTAWAYGARVLRAQTLTLRHQDYVESAQVIGEPRRRIIVAEILPNLLPIVAGSFIFTVIYGLGIYVVLSILGLVSPATASWGTMIQSANQASAMISGDWWWYAPPALCIAAVGIGLALLNFGIDEIVNPRARSARSNRKDVRFKLGLTPVAREARTPSPRHAAVAGPSAPAVAGVSEVEELGGTR